MPNFDRTGPQGQGPMTGRGMGRCGNGNGSGVGFGQGRGFGRGFGRGAGFGRGFGLGLRRATPSDDKSDIQNYVKDLEAELKDAKDYLSGLKDKK